MARDEFLIRNLKLSVMDYIYKPNSAAGQSRVKPVRRLPYHNRMATNSPGKMKLAWSMPKYQIPWRFVSVIAICIVAIVGLWWGGNTAKNFFIAKRDAKVAQELAQSQAEAETIKSNIKSQVGNAQEALKYGRQKQDEGNIREAVIAYELALEYEPNWRDACLCLGQAYLMMRDYENAEKVLTHALSLDPINPTTHDLLAILYENTGRNEQANNSSQKADLLASQMGLEIGG